MYSRIDMELAGLGTCGYHDNQMPHNRQTNVQKNQCRDELFGKNGDVNHATACWKTRS